MATMWPATLRSAKLTRAGRVWSGSRPGFSTSRSCLAEPSLPSPVELKVACPPSPAETGVVIDAGRPLGVRALPEL